jgi:hypothetical protein
MDINDDIIINQGKWGKEDYDDGDISMGTYVKCVSIPNNSDYIEGQNYYISGMGGLVYDKSTNKYRIGFGEDSKAGFCLKREVYIEGELLGTTLEREYSYVTYDDLIRNFVFNQDVIDDPSFLLRLKRDIVIEHVLKKDI